MIEFKGINNNWQINILNTTSLLKIKNIFDFPEIVLKTLISRGIDSEEKVLSFINSSVLSLYSPFYFKEMEKAVKRILDAVSNHELILVLGDRDVDGVTATAILYRFLEKIEANVVYRVPEGQDNYGLTNDIIDWAILNEISLIITVDCGITAIDEIKRASQFKIDVIVTDHHNPREVLPEAYAIINPKVEGSGYPFEFLSGASVALKLVLGIAEKLYFKEYHNQELVFIDIETTGLNPFTDEIIELGAVKVKDGIILEKFVSLIKPKKPIPKEIENLTGITNELLNKEGKTLDFVLEEFLNFAGERKIIGHNAIDFDLKFIETHLKKMGKRITNPVEDTLKMARVQLKNLKDHKLSTVANFLGIYFDRAKLHRSLMDAIVCAEVYRRLLIFRNQRYIELLEENLPYAAIGTIADIMPIVDENRNIVKTGLKYIKRTSVGLLTLLRELNVDINNIKAKDISFTVAPVLNSPGRLGDASFSVELLVSNKISEIQELTSEILKKDIERKNIIEDILDDIEMLISVEDLRNKKILIFSSEKFSKGTIGLIATRFCNIYRVPVVVMSIENNTITGSIRAPSFFDVLAFLDSLKEYFSQFGGHKHAGGFTAKAENIELIKKKMLEYVENCKFEEEKSVIDFEIEDPEELNMNSVRYLENILQPVGYKNQIPLILIRNIEVTSIKEIGKKLEHLLISGKKDNHLFNIVAWNFKEKANGLLKENEKFDFVLRPEINIYNGEEELRFILYDVRKTCG